MTSDMPKCIHWDNLPETECCIPCAKKKDLKIEKVLRKCCQKKK